ncbi:MAG: hypothetical protein ACRDO7_01325 [Nocardioidaceae bacterium]
MSRRRVRLVGALAAFALLCSVAACGLERPTEKDGTDVTKVGATRAQAETILDRYQKVRRTAYSLLAAGPLTSIEAAPVLLIDAGAIKAHRLLGKDAPPSALGSKDVTVTDVYSPQFDEYPLWFVAVVRDHDRDVTRVLVFARPRAASPWALMASPETVSTEAIPPLAVDADGALRTMPPGERSALAASPEDVVTTYASALDDEASAANDEVVRDSFIDQMRDVAEASSSIKGVTFSQTWKPHDVRYVARTADGGALVFATLTRDDDYRIEKEGLFVDWPKGSVQKAFLSGKLFGHGKLRYYHQVLLYVPAEGAGEPRAIGQYGGIIDGDGY